MTELSHQALYDKLPTTAELISVNSSNIMPLYNIILIVTMFISQLHVQLLIAHANARKHMLRKSGNCFICLRRGHLSQECKSSGRCRICNCHHHKSICEQYTAVHTKGRSSASD